MYAYIIYTGLDPAGPAFYDVSSTERLDKSQASYVDIIHSNGGTLTSVMNLCTLW